MHSPERDGPLAPIDVPVVWHVEGNRPKIVLPCPGAPDQAAALPFGIGGFWVSWYDEPFGTPAEFLLNLVCETAPDPQDAPLGMAVLMTRERLLGLIERLQEIALQLEGR